ncbi:hypothetical protein FJ420_23280 [Mesorhizobium sp. B3-1-3]|uniref:hypothetical protein n=1 Tax=unclassified Mesorhizobium TaxID=325217 RepID=UPI001125D895|nr:MULTISPECIES: hypothetical protein [unclassified Mesorhizobium]TPI58513.1 hypothetical protein FJ424_27340 [Mesorhizobium sp. B3-1-8]TPI67348.1 hypothetical protein FJ420_23280 [Mesorhizobium sp. B3-1-3]
MKFLIHETLRTLNTDDVFEFGLTEISKSHEHPDLYEAVTVFIRNRKSQKHKTSGLSEFDVVRSFMTYVGINLRAIAKDDTIEFDLNGLTRDQYIPLTKSIREIMDE